MICIEKKFFQKNFSLKKGFSQKDKMCQIVNSHESTNIFRAGPE